MRKSARVVLAAATMLAGTLVWAQGIPKLSKAQRSALIRKLSLEDRRWLEDFVAPIILSDEENLFLLLTEEHHREVFKEEFWKRREQNGLPPPLGPGYRTRYEELLRIADEKYDGRRQDAGRMVIAHGEPASMDELTSGEGCGDMFRDLEIWTYSELRAGGASVRRELFYRVSPGAPRKLWRYGDSDRDLFQPQACRKDFTELQRWECPRPKDLSILKDRCYNVTNCPATCRIVAVWNEIKIRHGTALGGRVEEARALNPPEVSLEGLTSLAARFPEVATAGAKTIALEAPGAVVEATPAPSRRQLSAQEIAEARNKVEPRFRDFLDLADPLLDDEQRSRFLQLSDREKDDFIREFWKKHSK